MQKTILAAAAALTVLVGGAATNRAEALPINANLAESVEGSTALQTVQFRRFGRAYYPRYRYVAPRRYFGPGSGTGLGRVYTGPGSGTGLGRWW